jgi:hypothetical protein
MAKKEVNVFRPAKDPKRFGKWLRKLSEYEKNQNHHIPGRWNCSIFVVYQVWKEFCWGRR